MNWRDLTWQDWLKASPGLLGPLFIIGYCWLWEFVRWGVEG